MPAGTVIGATGSTTGVKVGGLNGGGGVMRGLVEPARAPAAPKPAPLGSAEAGAAA